jgi:hypothetical protein
MRAMPGSRSAIAACTGLGGGAKGSHHLDLIFLRRGVGAG